jgi:hypothetical protein
VTEPTFSGATIALGAITITGTIFNMQADALLAGLFGGFVALRYTSQMTKWQLAASLVSATGLAGSFSPVAHAAALHYVSWLAAAGDMARLACAVAIGLFAQTLVPILMGWVKRSGSPKGDGK